MPEILRGGWNRALRSAWAGLVISLDYKWTLRGLDDESEEYASYLTQIHQRAAQVSSPTYFSFDIEIGLILSLCRAFLDMHLPLGVEAQNEGFKHK